MKQVKKLASAEYIAEMTSKLAPVFYDTPKEFFEYLAKSIMFLKLTEKEVLEMINDSIFNVKKTRISIADIASKFYEKSKNEKNYPYGKYPE